MIVPGGSEWCVLAEFPLCEFLPGREQSGAIASGLLFQALGRLGMSPECVEKIELALAEFVKDAGAHFNPGGQISGRVRVFCQKQGIDCAEMRGGWGFFLIGRGRNLPEAHSESPEILVDVYLYKEGE